MARRDSYRREFDSVDKATAYDVGQYGRLSWSSLLWQVEQEQLRMILDDAGNVPRRERYLDFACGTGRVTAYCDRYFQHSAGLDISESMVSVAREKYPYLEFLVGDFTNQPHVAGDDYDLITAFRFVLNADESDRIAALRWFRSLLRDESSRIILNNHSAAASHKAIPYVLRRLRGRIRTTGRILSHREISRMADAAGLRIVEKRGLGVIGAKSMSILGPDRSLRIQRFLADRFVAGLIGEDQIYVLAPGGDVGGQ